MSKHITEKQRYAISKMLQVPMSKKDIAEAIGVDRSNIYREIKRNCDSRSGKYNPDLAQRKADKRIYTSYEEACKKASTKGLEPRADSGQKPSRKYSYGISRNYILLDMAR